MTEIFTSAKVERGGNLDGVLRQVGFQGELGAYSEIALLRLEPLVKLQPIRTLAEVFAAVESGVLDAGVVPVENSLAGSIGETYDLLLKHSLTITGETVVFVDHCLLALNTTSLSDVRRVLSHPQALAQCTDYLVKLSVEQIPYYDTAGAARAINEEKLNSAAAIASERAADLYGLRILARSIQSNPDNFTRFYRIERQMRPPSSSNKTVYAVSLPHHPGSLVTALTSLASRSINLTKIESRPIKRDPWQYVFYLEFEGHASDRQVKEALNEMSNDSGMHRVLGSFALEGSTG